MKREFLLQSSQHRFSVYQLFCNRNRLVQRDSLLCVSVPKKQEPGENETIQADGNMTINKKAYGKKIAQQYQIIVCHRANGEPKTNAVSSFVCIFYVLQSTRKYRKKKQYTDW